jgi:pyridoxal phosphate enzyme (YggS family)
MALVGRAGLLAERDQQAEPGAMTDTSPSPSPSLIERLDEVRGRIHAIGGGERVTLVAVTKGFGPEVVTAALAAGLVDIGENYAQELVAKAAAVSLPTPKPGGVPAPRLALPRWHFLGPLQTNKAARLAPLVERWHGVDREAAGRALARHQPGAQVFVEVNVAGMAGRPGCRVEETEQLVEQVVELGIDVRGLMTVAPAAEPARARKVFRRLAELARLLGLKELSMGMSDDFETAIEEGATTVRLGRALFGPRPGRAGVER